ncbi:hypothetical protein [Mycobacterium heckeshornense]|uniref:hypothetical protein n=1 Tax=Mycobacterium heckeshornense TaxID=110505 RepID=UPI000AD72CBF|nr:hypothetical protein [Mycobacterium heckeshornense]
MTMHRHHYEIWDSTPTGADIVAAANTLPAALRLYMRARKTPRGHTINLLVDAPPARSR